MFVCILTHETFCIILNRAIVRSKNRDEVRTVLVSVLRPRLLTSLKADISRKTDMRLVTIKLSHFCICPKKFTPLARFPRAYF